MRNLFSFNLFLRCGQAKHSYDMRLKYFQGKGCGRRSSVFRASGWRNVWLGDVILDFPLIDRLFPDYRTEYTVTCPQCLEKVRESIAAKEEAKAARERESQAAVEQGCTKCRAPLKKGGSYAGWWDFDRADWACDKCGALICGSCANENLRKLQVKYGAFGTDLREAVNDDQNALYLEHELAPYCSTCHANLHRYGHAL